MVILLNLQKKRKYYIYITYFYEWFMSNDLDYRYKTVREFINDLNILL